MCVRLCFGGEGELRPGWVMVSVSYALGEGDQSTIKSLLCLVVMFCNQAHDIAYQWYHHPW